MDVGGVVVRGGWRDRRSARGLTRRFAGLILVAAVVSGCALHRGGVYHRVRAGDTLYRIGKAYGVSLESLRAVNRIDDPERIQVGTRLLVPRATRELPVQVITPTRAEDARSPSPERPVGERPFVWPVSRGLLTSRFGPRGAAFHDGIDIGAPVGTPVFAARAGQVLYSERLSGYGNIIIVGHDDGFATVYAHNSTHMVRAGQRVRQGQLIARVGASGRASGPNLHFEVRKGNVARNPLYFLPPAARSGTIGVGG